MRTRSLARAGVVAAGLSLAAAASPAQTPTQPVPAPAPAAGAVQSPLGSPVQWEGLFTVGGAVNGTDDYTGRVAEYKVVDPDALAAIRFLAWGGTDTVRFDVSGWNGGSARDQKYVASLDLNRVLKAHVSYLKFGHRLDHDPLTTYMDASSGIGGTFVAQSTNTDPGADYSIGYGDFKADLELALKNVTFFLGHERQTRGGYHQVMTIAHCATCHTSSYSKEMDELTSDFTAGARARFGALTVDYAYLNRSFDDEGATLLKQYDNAIQPATLQDIFLNRVQYDDAAGLLPFATVPELSKQMHTLRASMGVGSANLVGGFTKSRTTNEDQGLDIDYTGAYGRVVVPLFDNAVLLRADARRYSIESDDVFVDVIELVAPAGATAGKTYAQAYPTLGSPDFVRESALSRTPTELSAEVSVRPFRRTFLRAGYEWEQIDRDNFEVDETTTNTLYVAGRSQIGKLFNTRFRVQYDSIAHPFTYEHAAIPAVLQPFPSPGTPASPLLGLQYFEMYRSRQGDLTSFPTDRLLLEGYATFSPSADLALTVHYRYSDSQNDDLNFSEWGRTAHTPGFDLWYAPAEKWAFNLGYAAQREKLDTLFSTLAFSG
jgi:hypothetical protein